MRRRANAALACAIALACAVARGARAVMDPRAGAAANTIDAFGTTMLTATAPEAWRTGATNSAHTAVRFNNHARRALADLAPARAWDAAEAFLLRLDDALVNDASDGVVLHEFNDLPFVKHLDVSIRLEYHAMQQNGVLDRLATCDGAVEGGPSSCMGLQRSAAFSQMQSWWRRLKERYPNGHPYWVAEYLEFDMSGDGVDPTASVFIEHVSLHSGRHAEFVPAVREYFDAIGAATNAPSSEVLFKNVQRVVDLATSDGFNTSIWSAGIMFSRVLDAGKGGIESVRVLIYFNRHDALNSKDAEEDGYASEKTRQMVRLLELLKWTGDYDEFDRIDDFFTDDGGIGSVLQLDVLAREPTNESPSIIGPRVGVEITVGQTYVKDSVMPYLASHLLSSGLAQKDWLMSFTDALCKPTRADALSMRSRLQRPCFIKRRTAADKVELTRDQTGASMLPPISVSASHFKFIVQPGRSLYAKAYVGSQHTFKYCLDTDSISVPNTAVKYEPCSV